MKNIILASIFIFYTSASFAEVVNGFIVVDNQMHWLIDKDSSEPLALKALTLSVQNTLEKLSTFDRLRGQANLLGDNTVELESIDFVTLRKLIGEWTDHSGKVQLNFVDHTNLNIKKADSESNFTYSLSPGLNQSWRIFLGDGQKVLLGSLTLDEDKLKFELLDGTTGQVTESYHLLRKLPQK